MTVPVTLAEMTHHSSREQRIARAGVWGREMNFYCERLAVAMLLTETQHHAAPRGQNMARSREEESELNNATGQKTPPPRVASTVCFSLDDDGDVLAARPTHLVEVRPQPAVLRHTAEQIIETFVPVQVLDTPMPQLWDQAVELLTSW